MTTTHTKREHCTIHDLHTWGAHKTAELVMSGRGPETTVAHLFQEIGTARGVAHIIATENRVAAYYALQLPLALSRTDASTLRCLSWGYRTKASAPWFLRWAL